MKKNILILSVSVASILLSCKKEKEAETTAEPIAKTFDQIRKADWLIGEWGANFPDGSILTETWLQENDSTFSAKTYVVAGKDTVFSETVSLEQRAGKLNYVVTVPGQNQEKPVAFELSASSGKQLVFENPKHDFPNKIVYTRFENDSLVAEVSGIEKGKAKSESFPMKKIK